MHGRRQQAELEALIVSRLVEVIEVAGPYTPAEFSEILEALRTKLNQLLTVDILGPEWQKRTGASALQEVDFDDTTLTIESMFD
jgi:hypothetical protein